MILTLVCISRKPENFDNLPNPPHHIYNLPGDIPGFPIEEITKAYSTAWRNRESESSWKYINYLAHKRNVAVRQALEKYPDTTHIFLCDSYYLEQRESLEKLISDYQFLLVKGWNTILGGAVWGLQKTKLSHFLKADQGWYDKWGVPELRWVPHKWYPADDWLAFRFEVPLTGLYRTNHVSGIFIFPVTVWNLGARFEAPIDAHSVELSTFCEKAGIPKYIDFNAPFQRSVVYPFLKALRCSLAIRSRLKRLDLNPFAFRFNDGRNETRP